jgi:hypothetical protein
VKPKKFTAFLVTSNLALALHFIPSLSRHRQQTEKKKRAAIPREIATQLLDPEYFACKFLGAKILHAKPRLST